MVSDASEPQRPNTKWILDLTVRERATGNLVPIIGTKPPTARSRNVKSRTGLREGTSLVHSRRVCLCGTQLYAVVNRRVARPKCRPVRVNKRSPARGGLTNPRADSGKMAFISLGGLWPDSSQSNLTQVWRDPPRHPDSTTGGRCGDRQSNPRQTSRIRSLTRLRSSNLQRSASIPQPSSHPHCCRRR